MTYPELAAEIPPSNANAILDEAMEAYLGIKPEVRHAIRKYATVHRIDFSTAVAEACRSYFMPE